MAITDPLWQSRVDAWVETGQMPPKPVRLPQGAVPRPFVPFRERHFPEYTRRLLAVAAAVAGWPPERVAPLWPFVECASRAFEAEAVEPWLAALGELERRAGITVGAGMSPGSSEGGT